MKKQSTLKRALALGMSATMVGATLAGCGGSASSTAATSTETASSAATEAEATTDSDKPFAGTTLTWYTTLNGNVSDNFANLGDTPWAKYVEEQTGITIEFQHPTQGSEAEEFAVMLASGEYPDIIEYTWTTYSGGAGAAINDGVIISLDDYMADATNLSKPSWTLGISILRPAMAGVIRCPAMAKTMASFLLLCTRRVITAA